MDNVDARNSAGSRKIERHLAAVWWRFSRQSDETSFMLHALTYEPAILVALARHPNVAFKDAVWHQNQVALFRSTTCSALFKHHQLQDNPTMLSLGTSAVHMAMAAPMMRTGNDDTVDDNDEKDGDDNKSTLGAVHFQGHRVSCARGRRGLHRGECGLHTR